MFYSLIAVTDCIRSISLELLAELDVTMLPLRRIFDIVILIAIVKLNVFINALAADNNRFLHSRSANLIYSSPAQLSQLSPLQQLLFTPYAFNYGYTQPAYYFTLATGAIHRESDKTDIKHHDSSNKGDEVNKEQLQLNQQDQTPAEDSEMKAAGKLEGTQQAQQVVDIGTYADKDKFTSKIPSSPLNPVSPSETARPNEVDKIPQITSAIKYNIYRYQPILYSIPIPLQWPASSQFHAQDNLGQYHYGYSGPLSSKQELKTFDGITQGSYSYIDSNGQLQAVQYVSDPVSGFHVAATNLPKEVKPVDIPDSPEIKQAKEKHFQAQTEAIRKLSEIHANIDNDSDPKETDAINKDNDKNIANAS